MAFVFFIGTIIGTIFLGPSIIEYVMDRYEWCTIWVPASGVPVGHLGFYVGVWTGPDLDLLCVKRCATAMEAEKYLSPRADTLFVAVLASALKRWKLGRKI